MSEIFRHLDARLVRAFFRLGHGSLITPLGFVHSRARAKNEPHNRTRSIMQSAASRLASLPGAQQKGAPSHHAKQTAAQRLASLPHFRHGGMVHAKPMQHGGKVTGPGGPTDDQVPAMLSPGEVVMPADTVQSVGAARLLAMIDATHQPSGKPAFKDGAQARADGGEVGTDDNAAQQSASAVLAANPALAGVPAQQPATSNAAQVLATLPGATAGAPQLDWQQRNNLRNADTQSSSIVASTAAEGRDARSRLMSQYSPAPAPATATPVQPAAAPVQPNTQATAVSRMSSLSPRIAPKPIGVPAFADGGLVQGSARARMAAAPQVRALADGGEVVPVEGTGRNGYQPNWTVSADQTPARPALPAPAPSASTAMQTVPTGPNFTMGGNGAQPGATTAASRMASLENNPTPAQATAAPQARAVPSGSGTGLVPVAGTGDNGYRPNFTVGGNGAAPVAEPAAAASGMEASRARVNGQFRNDVDAMKDVGGAVKGAAGQVLDGVQAIASNPVVRGASRVLGAVDGLDNAQQMATALDRGEGANALNKGVRSAASILSVLPTPVGAVAGAYSAGNAVGDLIREGMEHTESGRSALDRVGSWMNGVANMAGAGVDSAALDRVNSPGFFNSGKQPPAPATPAVAPQAPAPRDPYAEANAAKIKASEAAGAAPVTAPSGVAIGAQPRALPDGQIHFDPNTKTYSGRNVGPDATVQDGRGGSAISQMNQDAAQRLNGLSTAQSLAQVAETNANNPASPPLVVQPTAKDPWQQRLDERNALVSASSIDKKTAARGMAEWNALRGQQAEAQAIDAANGRAAMQDAGQTARARMQELGANRRAAQANQVARSELALKQNTATIQSRAAQRLDQLHGAYEAATTPDERAKIVEQIRLISGRDKPDQYKVAAGGQQLGPNGEITKTPDRIYNASTGQVVEPAAPRQTAPSVAVGARTTHPDGQFSSGGKTVTIKNGFVTEVK